MDSFFSLFDPSDGKQSSKKVQRSEQDSVKKKGDTPKGRRRGRRGHNKSETLPEESSFLCDPELSTELLVKDGSYIDSYIEVNRKDEEPELKPDPEKKPKRRNSGRKNRRKKYKTSPMKDIPGNAWTEDSGESITNWNNMSLIQKNCNETIGKNVNDLSDFKNNNIFYSMDCDSTVCDVIDKLEKVGLKDDSYLSREFDMKDFHMDMNDSYDETWSDEDDSGDEVYGSLPPEPRFGNVEYKLQLVAPCEKRFQHLVTQLKWRLRSGGGNAVYVLGVRDCGALRGLRAAALGASLRALAAMAAALPARLRHVAVRRVAARRAVAEVYVTKLADTQQSVELRVAVMGANEAGKSTLIGVLTQGELDNGRGSARLNMFRHLHEVKSGRTSSLSHEILGFDAQGNVVNYGCSELMTAERIGERSAKLVSFLDLAGHTKYQRTTLHGLSGYCPHYAMLVISATAGITRITEEHLALLVALDLPFFAVITKCDIAGPSVHALLRQLAAVLARDDKKPMLITDENQARECVAPQRLIIDSLTSEERVSQKDQHGVTRVPVFPVSCVKGAGLNVLHAYLLTIQPPMHRQRDNESCEFQIDEIFHVGDSGPVVGGLLTQGRLCEGDDLIIGPFETGEFREVSVCTIYRNRARCGQVRAGQCASLGLAGPGAGLRLRPGMVVLARPAHATAGDKPAFGRCAPGHCKAAGNVKDIVLNRMSQTKDKKDRKSVRRKNKNLLQVLADAESSLTKSIDNDPNIYKSDSDEKTALDRTDENIYRSEKDMKVSVDPQQCVCDDTVLLEDPNDPRGCMYFQASVHVLRHSTAISPGFQCTVHVGNVRQTAIIEGILSRNSEVRAGSSAPLVFRLTRCPEYLAAGRRLLLTAGQGTRAIGRVTQVFPYVP